MRLPPVLARLDRAKVLAVAVPVIFLATGLLVYGTGLGDANREYFDEKHYLRAARAFAEGQWLNPDWSDHRPENYEHPPLAKYWIALSIKHLGDEPQDWRIPSAIYGALGLAGMALLARRVFASQLAGIFAPTLLLLEPMYYVHARTATLEIFVVVPLIWAFAFAFGDRSWERWAAGGAFALAFAAKLTALFLFPLLALVLVWRWAAVRSWWGSIWRTAVATVAVPAGLLLALLYPFIKIFAGWWGLTGAAYHLVFLTKRALSWGASADVSHPDAIDPLYWFTMQRPTWLYVVYYNNENTILGVMYAIGNPVIWWGGPILASVLLAVPAARWFALARAGRTPGQGWSMHVPEHDLHRVRGLVFALAAVLFAYVPHFFLGRITLLYYMTLVVPWLALLAGGAVARLMEASAHTVQDVRAQARDPGRPRWLMLRHPRAVGGWAGWTFATLFLVAALAAFIYFLPLFGNVEVPKATLNEVWDTFPWMERTLSR